VTLEALQEPYGTMARRAVLCAAWLALSSPAAAQQAEVLHWWTSQGESLAVKVLADAYRKAGGTWVDTAVAGGDNARNIAINRMAGGKPPTVAQFQATTQFHEIFEEGLLTDIDVVAGQQDWDRLLPPTLKQFIKLSGKYYAVPVAIHNPTWFWYSKEVLAKSGVTAEPDSIEALFAALDKVKARGYTALALGGQAWQEALLFNAILHGHSADLYRRFYTSTDGAVALTPEFKQVLRDFKRLKDYVDAGSPNRDWNVAASMLITNKAGFQVIGDYVKAEFMAAGKQVGRDYGCFLGFGPRAAYMVDSDVFVFPKSRNPQAARAQQLFASVLMSPQVQVEFSRRKGSVPVRADVDMGSVDRCTQIGLEAMRDPTRHVAPPEQLTTPERSGAIGDVITEFWNTKQTVDRAARALAASLRL
jgi:glucose/mannose transport system substrate-binding protein